MLKMSTIGQNPRVQTFAKVVDRQVDEHIYDNLFAPNLSGERRLDRPFLRSWNVNINLNKGCFFMNFII